VFPVKNNEQTMGDLPEDFPQIAEKPRRLREQAQGMSDPDERIQP
jgi:hypothetical protein